MTIAMSLLVHGEAVRFNRGQSRGDDFDFKYMRGRDGREYPYVSSQCFKKYWRESLPCALSPIIREKDAGGKDKNQAYTSGNPIEYVDDDLFGYMIAGATEAEEDSADAEAQDPAEDVKRIFEADNLKDAEALRQRLLDAANPLSKFILDKTSGLKEVLDASELQEALLNALDEAARSNELPETSARGTSQEPRRRKKAASADEIRERNKKGGYILDSGSPNL